MFDDASDSSGKAADTGSAVHAAVHHWHEHKDYSAAVQAMRGKLADFPLADLHDAELHFRPYTLDPRNIEAILVASEEKVTFKLPPADDDKTQSPIVIRGTLDQVRRTPIGLALFDLKTGQRYDGYEMMHVHAAQVAAYCIGASQLLGEPVQPGALITTRGYRKRQKLPVDPPGVFWEYTWTLEHCHFLLDAVRYKVRDIRNGAARPGPGEHCSFCPIGGLDNCLRRVQCTS